MLVANGTYTGPGNKNLNYGGKAITVMSEHGAASCIIDCEDDGWGFRFRNGEGNDSILRDIAIINGGSDSLEGGIECYGNSSLTITECVIWSCAGSGIYCSSSSPIITGCTIKSNDSSWFGGGGMSPVLEKR